MELGPEAWKKLRKQITAILKNASAHQGRAIDMLTPQSEATMHLPFLVSDTPISTQGVIMQPTWAPCSAVPKTHCHQIGCIFRLATMARLFGCGQWNDIRRPWGQLKAPDAAQPEFAPCRRFDFELNWALWLACHLTDPSRSKKRMI